MKNTKQAVREQVKQTLLEQPQLSRAEEDLLAKRIITLLPPGALRVHCYGKRFSNELPTQVLQTLLREQRDVNLTMVNASPSAQKSEESFDVVIVPMVAFDSSLHRLGRGGGWYDVFLKTQPSALKIGLAYEAAKLKDSWKPEPHDVPMDVVMTEKTVHHRLK